MEMEFFIVDGVFTSGLPQCSRYSLWVQLEYWAVILTQLMFLDALISSVFNNATFIIQKFLFTFFISFIKNHKLKIDHIRKILNHGQLLLIIISKPLVFRQQELIFYEFYTLLNYDFNCKILFLWHLGTVLHFLVVLKFLVFVIMHPVGRDEVYFFFFESLVGGDALHNLFILRQYVSFNVHKSNEECNNFGKTAYFSLHLLSAVLEQRNWMTIRVKAFNETKWTH